MVEWPPLAIIIVTWNVRDLTLACLESLYADLERSGLSAAVWIVDNASRDGTLDAVRANFPQTKIIASDKNLGFAGGNNAALRAIGFPDGEADSLPQAVLLLNPDTIVRPSALNALLEIFTSLPQVGVAGPRLFYEDGSFQHSAFAFPGLGQLAIDLFPFPARLRESSLNGRYPRLLYDRNRPFPIDHPLGAAMLLRREAIRQVGLMDEGYHMYCEEIDWAMRIKRAGWQAYCVPAAEVVHYSGQSTRQMPSQSIINLWSSRLRLYALNYAPIKRWLALAILRAGMNRQIRLVARDSSVDEETRAEIVAAYASILKQSRQPVKRGE